MQDPMIFSTDTVRILCRKPLKNKYEYLFNKRSSCVVKIFHTGMDEELFWWFAFSLNLQFGRTFKLKNTSKSICKLVSLEKLQDLNFIFNSLWNNEHSITRNYLKKKTKHQMIFHYSTLNPIFKRRINHISDHSVISNKRL